MVPLPHFGCQLRVLFLVWVLHSVLSSIWSNDKFRFLYKILGEKTKSSLLGHWKVASIWGVRSRGHACRPPNSTIHKCICYLFLGKCCFWLGMVNWVVSVTWSTWVQVSLAPQEITWPYGHCNRGWVGSQITHRPQTIII